jgi:hypothetical protein
MQTLVFPNNLRDEQQRLLKKLGVDSGDHKSLAAAVKRLSDFYVKHPEKSTPWHESWAQVAYLIYYLPLNWWRACGVLRRGQQLNFFDGFDHYIDFGSGLGSVSHALDAFGLRFKSALCLEQSPEAISVHSELAKASLTPLSWQSAVSTTQIKPMTLAIFSYSFTELEHLPSWVNNCDGLMMIEPSTKDDARRLQALRSELMEHGWFVWGPCTHTAACPMLLAGERDWCHDRFTWRQPAWLKAIEDHLPMKNGTLPCAWMMFKKIPPNHQAVPLARVTGDLLEYKGYAKQLVCRGSSREFLSWQKKIFKHYPEVARGDLVRINQDVLTKGDELRLSSEEDLLVLK